MESECGWPQNSSPDRALTTEAYDLQSQINTALATADLQLLQYSNSLATLRREEEKTLLERVVKLQRHHKAVRDKLGNGENAAKAIALLLKAFRVAKDIAKAEYRMLVQAEIALGPISSRPLSHFPARQERTVKLMREKPPAVSQSMRFSRSAVYMRKKRLERNDAIPRSSTKSTDPAAPLMRAVQMETESKLWQEFMLARSQGDILGLVRYMHCTEKAKEMRLQKSEWAAPISIGGHAVSALADLSQNQGNRPSRAAEVAEALTNDIHVLVQYIEGSALEVQDPSVVLLYYVAEQLSSEIKTRLVNIGVFQALIKVMRNGFQAKRQMAAETCKWLYDGSDTRKDEFVRLEGVATLVHIMNLDNNDPDFLHNALLRLYLLTEVTPTQAGDDTPSFPRIQRLNSAGVLSAINTFDRSQVRSPQLEQETLELIDRLAQVLQSDPTAFHCER